MRREQQVQAAEFFLQEAYRAQKEKDYEEAVALYRRSLAACPTAEAHTFLAWTYSHMDRLDDAIKECRRAIAMDPDFGNPYNDIGSYLIKKGKLREAIVWLKRAKTARRYQPRHYPYENLGRIYMAMDRVEEAQREFAQARFIRLNLVDACVDDSDGYVN
jgi:Tfp pilus assembly protein PilF